MSRNLLSPGELVVCKPSATISNLILWSKYRSDIDEDNPCLVSVDELMIVIEAKKPTKQELEDKNAPLMPEWKIGAYKIISSSGNCGWIGAGWVVPVNKNYREKV